MHPDAAGLQALAHGAVGGQVGGGDMHLQAAGEQGLEQRAAETEDRVGEASDEQKGHGDGSP
ncbi:hypothetical protein D3C78_1993730 [compost metagenome]